MANSEQLRLLGGRIMLSCAVLALLAQISCVFVFPLEVPPDGTFYLDGASHIASGNGFMAVNEYDPIGPARPIADYPPAYPLTIAAAMYSSGLDVFTASKLVNVLAYLLHIGAWSAVFRLSFGRNSYQWPLATLLLTLNCGLISYLNSALSEMLFSALIASAVLSTLLLNRARSSITMAVVVTAVSLLLSTMVLTRSLGIAIVPCVTVAAIYNLRSQGHSWRNALLVGSVPCCIAALVFVAWACRNLGHGNAAVFLPTDSADHTTVLSAALSIPRYFLFGCLAIPTTVGRFADLLWLPIFLTCISAISSVWSGGIYRRRGTVGIAIGILLLYGAMVVVAGMLSPYSYSANYGFIRYFTVLQPCFVLVVLASWRLGDRRGPRTGMPPLANLSVILLLTIMLVGGVRRQLFTYQQAKGLKGVDYYASLMKKVPAGDAICSNISRHIGIHTGIWPKQLASIEELRVARLGFPCVYWHSKKTHDHFSNLLEFNNLLEIKGVLLHEDDGSLLIRLDYHSL